MRAGNMAQGSEVLARETTGAIAEVLASITFDDMGELLPAGEEVLRYVAAPARLAALLARTAEDATLLAKCERFKLFEKVVLYEDPASRARLRLHLFGREVKEAHHHRASFVSLVLRGSYTHLLFGDEQHLEEPCGGRPSFRPLMAAEQRPGAAYALHHAMVHATLAKPETVSLILQAPAERPSFRIYDLETGRRRDRVGSGDTAQIQEAGESEMTAPRVLEIGASLRRWELI